MNIATNICNVEMVRIWLLSCVCLTPAPVLAHHRSTDAQRAVSAEKLFSRILTRLE